MSILPTQPTGPSFQAGQAPSTLSQIGSVKVAVSKGNVANKKCDAYIVPQFQNGAAAGGVSRSVAINGGEHGIYQYDDFARANGPLPLGKAYITESGGGNSKKIIHVSSVVAGGDPQNNFETVHYAIYNALKAAQSDASIEKIVVPVLGTGDFGTLTTEQSAKAMLSGVQRFADEGGSPLDFEIVVFEGNGNASHDLVLINRVLSTKSYLNAAIETGQKEPMTPIDWFKSFGPGYIVIVDLSEGNNTNN